MNTHSAQELVRQAKKNLLQWRIQIVRRQIDKVQPSTPESRKLMLKLLRLVQQRNNLYTPADVAQIEKSRGLA